MQEEDDIEMEFYTIEVDMNNFNSSSKDKVHNFKYTFDSNKGVKSGTGTFKLQYLLEVGVNNYPQFQVKPQRYGEDVKIMVYMPESATGNLHIQVELDGNPYKSVDVPIKDGEVYYVLKDLDIGHYYVNVSYGDNVRFYKLCNETQFDVEPMIEFNRRNDLYPNNFTVDLILPPDANGKLVVFDYYTNVEFGSVDVKNGKAVLNLSCLPLGLHVLSAKYTGTDYHVNETYRQQYLIEPFIVVPDGENATTTKNITFQMPPNATGKLKVTVDGKAINVTLSKGMASIKLSDFKPGNHTIVFNFTDSYYGEYNGSDTFEILPVPVKIIGKNIKMSYYDGTYFKVTVYGKDGKLAKGVNVIFYVNGMKYKTVKTNNKGVAKFKVILVPKTYKITAESLGAKITKKVTVKQILTLKSVKVKKSAKKLVLTATLKKVNGKYLKSKAITFKFNGKKYKAKTNKKGVAKVTIKKAVLKKLKVGKKVKYQATYIKDTVKKSAKVKR